MSSPRRLNCGIEGQQVSLRRNRGDEINNRTDALCRLVERADGLIGIRVSSTAACAIFRPPVVCLPIESICAESASVSAAVAFMCSVISPDAPEAELMLLSVSSAVCFIAEQVTVNEAAAP